MVIKMKTLLIIRTILYSYGPVEPDIFEGFAVPVPYGLCFGAVSFLGGRLPCDITEGMFFESDFGLVFTFGFGVVSKYTLSGWVETCLAQ